MVVLQLDLHYGGITLSSNGRISKSFVEVVDSGQTAVTDETVAAAAGWLG